MMMRVVGAGAEDEVGVVPAGRGAVVVEGAGRRLGKPREQARNQNED